MKLISILTLGLGLTLVGLASGQITGTIVDASLAPIEGAIVSVQATTQRDTTAADGTFSLPGATGGALTIVAAHKTYYNASASVTPPATGVTITLEAVPQSDDPDYDFLDPASCNWCHPDQYSQWEGSPMSLAGQNLWLYDIYDGTGTAGGQGGFVYKRDSIYAGNNPGSECASCHQPEPWIRRPHSGLQDSTKLSNGAMHGVSCEVCHKIADIDESEVNYPGIYPGTVTFTRPGPMDGPVQYGVLGDTSYHMPNFMRPSYQPQLTSAMCAACHQDKNDPDEDGDFEDADGVISEPTYLEWLATPYADPQSSLAATCVDCHMPPYGATKVSTAAGAPDRDPETIRHHRIEGTTAEYLENAVEMNLRAWEQNGELRVRVAIENRHTGHHVPTGVTVRNMVLLVEVTRVVDGTTVTYLSGPLVDDLGGIGDPKLGYYAGLPGKLFAKVNRDAAGLGPVFFTEATSIHSDNRIPALATDVSEFTFELPAGTKRDLVQIRAKLIYRRAFRFLVDAKLWRVDGHGNPLEDVSPPHFGHLMEERSLVWPRKKEVE